MLAPRKQLFLVQERLSAGGIVWYGNASANVPLARTHDLGRLNKLFTGLCMGEWDISRVVRIIFPCKGAFQALT